MSRENVAVIRGAYEAFRRGDVTSVLAAFDPKIEWNEAENFPYADGNPYVGHQAVVEGIFTRIGEEWDGFTLAVDQVLDAGENVVALGRYRGRFKATGTSIDAQFAHVWWFRDGRAVRFQQYADTAQVLSATGR